MFEKGKMMEKKFRFLLLMVFMIIIFSSVADLYSMQFKAGDDIVISSDEFVEGHLFFASENFEFHGAIDGDIAGACKEVEISGDVDGDLWIAAQSVVISGNISGTAVIAAQQITIDGNCEGDILGVCEDFELTKDSNLKGELYFFCEDISINGPVLSDVKGSAYSVRINSNIDGDVDICVENFEIGTEGLVKGDLDYECSDKVSSEDEAKIIGKIFHSLPEIKVKDDGGGWKIFVKLIGLISYFILGLIILLPLKKHTDLVILQQRNNIWFCLLIGFIVFVLTPILAVILCITIIGIPLALLTVLVFMIVWYLSSMFVMTYLGQRIIGLFKKDYAESLLLSFVIGLVVIELLKIIPVVGILVTLFVWFVGVGAFLIARKVLIVELKERGIV